MKKSLLLLSCLAFQALFPSAPSDLPEQQLFRVVSHMQAVLDHKKTYVIGGDVNTSDINIGVFEVVNNKPKLVLEFKTLSKDIFSMTEKKSFTPLVVEIIAYLKEHYPKVVIKMACFASPGTTNATKDYLKHHDFFEVDGRAIKAQAGIEKVFVVNDFEVVGFGVQAIDQSNLVTIQQPKLRPNEQVESGTQFREGETKLIVGAGNGLGTGLMLWSEKYSSYVPSPISWSYVEFQAHSPFELRLNDYLQIASGSHSWGKVLGAHGGILRIYAFLQLQQAWQKLSDTMTDDNADEIANEIVELYKQPMDIPYKHYQEVFDNREKDPVCQEAVDLYMKLYARLVRNVVFAQLPYGGVYITNSIAENNPELFTDPAFMQEVLNIQNGFLSDYFSKIPIFLVKKTDGLSMYGAAVYGLVYNQPDMHKVLHAQKK